MLNTVSRRGVVCGVGVALCGAGCLGGDDGAGESGTVEHPDEEHLTVDVESGDTLRVDVTNEEGVVTAVEVLDPEYSTIAAEDVESETTITHDAELGGTYRVQIEPLGEAAYEVSVE